MASRPKASSETTRTFRSERGEELKGSFVSARDDRATLNAAGKDPVVVLAHGYTSNRNSCRFAEIAAALADAGVSSFRFDHPCAIGGLSERNGPFRMGNHHDEVADIHAAVTHMRDSGYDVVCVLGHSKGGCNVIKYAHDFPDDCPPRIINLAGRFCPGKASLEKRFGAGILERLQNDGPLVRKEVWGTWELTYDDVKERIELPMDEYAMSIGKNERVTMLCVHGREDAVIDYAESERCARLSSSDVVIVDGGCHNFTSEASGAAMIEAVVRFVVTS